MKTIDTKFWLLAILSICVLTLLIAGCAPTSPNDTTVITGAHAVVSDNYHTQGQGAEDVEETTYTTTPSVNVGDSIYPPVRTTTTVVDSKTRLPIAVPTTQPTYMSPFVAITSPSAQVGGNVFNAPIGSTVTLHTVKHTSRRPEEETRNRVAESSGAIIHTSDKTTAAGFKADAPTVQLSPSGAEGTGGGNKADGGNTSFSFTSFLQGIAASVKGEAWLWIVGVGLMLTGVVYGLVERLIGGIVDWELLIGAEVAGVAFIAAGITAEQHPSVFIFLFLVILAVIAWYVYQWKTKQVVSTASSTLSTTTPVVVPAATPSVVAVAETDAKKAYDVVKQAFIQVAEEVKAAASKV